MRERKKGKKVREKNIACRMLLGLLYRERVEVGDGEMGY